MKAGPVSVPSPHFQMSQATFVVGAIGVGWILWLAAQNKLATYWTLLIGGGASSSATTSTSSSTTTLPGVASGGAGATTQVAPGMPGVSSGGAQ